MSNPVSAEDQSGFDPVDDLLNVSNFNSPTAAFEGAGPLSGAASAIEQFKNGDMRGVVIDTLGIGLDLMGIMANPLKSLLSYGIGWLIEHISFLKEPLDILAGDPAAVANKAQSWRNIAEHLTRSAEEFSSSLNKVSQSSGQAMAQYSSAVQDYIRTVESAAQHAYAASKVIDGAGVAVGVTRGLVREWISNWTVDTAFRWLGASALTAPTGGGAQAVFITDRVWSGVNLFNKIAGKLRELLKLLKGFSKGARSSGGAFSNASRKLDEFIGGGAGGSKSYLKRGKAGDDVDGASAGRNPDNASDATRAASGARPLKERVDDFESRVDSLTSKKVGQRAEADPKLDQLNENVNAASRRARNVPTEGRKAKRDAIVDQRNNYKDELTLPEAKEIDAAATRLSQESKQLRDEILEPKHVPSGEAVENSLKVAKEIGVQEHTKDDRANQAEKEYWSQKDDSYQTKWRTEGTLD